ncbi:MAG: hypothetical protein ACKO0V_22390 [bacterium]
MDRTKYVSRRQAARSLGVSVGTLSKIAEAAGISRHRLPGHNREYLEKQAIQRLADQFKAGQVSA